VNFDVKQFQQRFGTYKVVVRVLPIFMSSLLYIEVWNIRWKLPTRQKSHCWSLIKSSMICCLIWLLS